MRPTRNSIDSIVISDYVERLCRGTPGGAVAARGQAASAGRRGASVEMMGFKRNDAKMMKK